MKAYLSSLAHPRINMLRTNISQAPRSKDEFDKKMPDEVPTMERTEAIPADVTEEAGTTSCALGQVAGVKMSNAPDKVSHRRKRQVSCLGTCQP